MSMNYIIKPEIHRVVGFEIIGPYTLRVIFDDHTEQVINFAPMLLGPMFGPLQDISLFNQVRLNKDFGALEWPNGADIDPMVLYDWPDHAEIIAARWQEIPTG